MKKKRTIYPLDITGLTPLVAAAKKRTKLTSTAQLLKLAIARGLPILEAQLSAKVEDAGQTKAEAA